MAKSDPAKPLDEVDFQIIAALSLGMTQEAAGKWVLTAEFPAGVSDRTVRNRVAANQEAYDRLVMRIGAEMRRKQTDFEELSKDRVREEIAKLRGKAIEVKKRVLDHALTNDNDTTALALGDKAADSLMDRDLGRPSQIHKVEGEVNHTHRIWGQPQPAGLLAEQERDIAASEDLLASLPPDVVEAEVIQ